MAVFSSAFLPGFRLSLVGVSVVLLAACASPGILHAIYTFQYLSEYYGHSTESVCVFNNQNSCYESEFTIENANGGFVEYVGWLMTNPFVACTPAYAGILPQIGLFQTLALTLMSDIVFYSEPEEYVGKFTAELVKRGASCLGSRCKFQHARKLYGKNLGFMFVGAVLLMDIGLVVATVMLYPSAWVIHARRAFGALLGCWKKRQPDSKSSDLVEELEEVGIERQHVNDVIQPFIVEPVDVEAINSPAPTLSVSVLKSNRDQLPPVVMHKLRKVYPCLGGSPPKVALKLLDMHVPRGQVLGKPRKLTFFSIFMKPQLFIKPNSMAFRSAWKEWSW